MFSFIRTVFILFLPYLLQATPLPTKNIKKVIQDSYIKHYPTIKIESIRVTQFGKTPKNFNQFKEQEIIISTPSLKKEKSTISVVYSSPQKDKKIYFKYQIKATIGLYKANTLIQRNTLLTLENSHFEQIPFTNLLAQPINEHHINQYTTKRTIKKNKIITISDIKKSIDIIKNQKITATISEGELKITFQAKTLQSGTIGDVIKIKRGKNTIFKAIIKSKNSVEVID